MSIVQTASPRSLRARWVFPVAGPPLRDAAVTISQGRIVAVGSPPDDVPIEDLGQVAIVPGLVNAHTHLEFSDLASPIGRPGMGLVEWLGSVIQHRASCAGTGPFVRGTGLAGECRSRRHHDRRDRATGREPAMPISRRRAMARSSWN